MEFILTSIKLKCLLYTLRFTFNYWRDRECRKKEKKKTEQNSGENSTWFSTKKLIIFRMPWDGSILYKHVPAVVTVVFPLKWYWKVLKAPQTHKMGENHVPKPKAPPPHLIEAEGSLCTRGHYPISEVKFCVFLKQRVNNLSLTQTIRIILKPTKFLI